MLRQMGRIYLFELEKRFPTTSLDRDRAKTARQVKCGPVGARVPIPFTCVGPMGAGLHTCEKVI